MFDRPIANLRHKIDLALKTTACSVAAIAALLVGLGFLCAAIFMWVAQSYGAIVASLTLGGAFVSLALIAVLVAVILHRRKPPPIPRQPEWWKDPVLLATAIDIGRALGGRKMTLMALAGALVVGILLNRPSRKRDEDEQA